MKLTPGYSRENALVIGNLSNLVYQEWEVVKKTLSGMGELTIYDVADTQAFLLVTDTHALVLSRGTSSLKDFFTDLNFIKMDEGDYQAHSGFCIGLNHIWHKLLVDISDNDDKKIILGGHSLGGGLSVVGSCRLLQFGIEHDVYTYGCPRSVNKEMAEWYNNHMRGKHHRHVVNNDMVTRIPPRVFDYSHVGTLRYFTEDGTQDDDISNWQRFLDRVHGRFHDIGVPGTDGLKDHFYVSSYKSCLEKAIKQ